MHPCEAFRHNAQGLALRVKCPLLTRIFSGQVVANLYPFRQTVTAEQPPSYETAVENIDIGSLLNTHSKSADQSSGCTMPIFLRPCSMAV